MKVRLAWSALLVSLLLLVSSPAGVMGQDIKSNSGSQAAQEIALKYVATTYGIPFEKLRIIDEYPLTNGITGEILTGFTVSETTSGVPFKVVVDSSGKAMDLSAFKKMLGMQYWNKYGRLSPALYDLLQSNQPDNLVSVAIWLSCDTEKVMYEVAGKYPDAKLEGFRPSKSTGTKLYQQISAEMANSLKQAYSVRQEPVLQLIQSRGFRDANVTGLAPVVFARIPGTLIQEIAQRSDVDRIYRLRSDYRPALDVAAPTICAPSVWSSNFTGSGVKVAIIEPDAVDFTHPNLDHAKNGDSDSDNYYNTDNICISQPGWPDWSNHATECIGTVASDNNTYKGIAPGVKLLSGNTCETGDNLTVAAIDWAIGKEADIIDVSFSTNTSGQIAFMDRFLDHIVYGHGRTVTVAAGNIGDGDQWVTSPGLGYNMITVGNFSDNSSVTWADDYMCANSSFKNPAVGNREKPELAAPGDNIHTTEPGGGFIDAGGTSLSAPIVAGEVALLMEQMNQQDSTLKRKPELLKAIIMTSALHNIEGESRLSDKDGVGGISAKHAAQIFGANHWAKGHFRKWNDGSTPYILESQFSNDSMFNFTFNASQGDRVRVALCWPIHPFDTSNYTYPDPVLSTDLDLYVYAPGGLAACSASSDNNYEIVDFTASATGQYRIRFYNAEMNTDLYEYYGLSWDARGPLRTLTTATGANGTITNPGVGTFIAYDNGQCVPLLATPVTDYGFVNWTGNTGTIDNTTAPSTTITMNGDYSITANFALGSPRSNH